MNKSVKATLLSAFVFPGVGHFHLRKYIPGTVLAGTALVSLYFIVSQMVERALQIVDRIQRGEVQPDIAVVAELVSRQSMGAGAELLNLAWTVLIISWLIGIADSYRVGRLQGRADVGSG